MTFFSKRPIIHEKAIHQALEAMRAGHKLRAHPLQISVIITSKFASPHAVGGDTAVQVAIFAYLREIITGRLAELRQVCQLPPPDQACADSDLVIDFKQDNRELESWSLLYYRYVCVDLDLSMKRIGSLTGRDQRLLRYRQSTGYQPSDRNYRRARAGRPAAGNDPPAAVGATGHTAAQADRYRVGVGDGAALSDRSRSASTPCFSRARGDWQVGVGSSRSSSHGRR